MINSRCYASQTRFAFLTRIKWKLLCIWNIFSKLTMGLIMDYPLKWRHNKRNCVSNHQCPDCLLNRLFRRRSKNTSKLCVTGLCAGNSPVTGEFPAQRTSNAENVSIQRRHHANNYHHHIHTTATHHPQNLPPTPYYQLILATKLIIYVFISYILVFSLLLQAVNTEPIYSTSVSRVPLCRHGVPSD